MSSDPMEARLQQLGRIGGQKLVIELIDLFLQTTPERLEMGRNALAQENRKEVARTGHTLGSSAANLGLLELQAIAAELEREAPCAEANALAGLLDRLTAAWPQTCELLLRKRNEINP